MVTWQPGSGIANTVKATEVQGHATDKTVAFFFDDRLLKTNHHTSVTEVSPTNNVSRSAHIRLTWPDRRTDTPTPRHVKGVRRHQSRELPAAPTWWTPQPEPQHMPKWNPIEGATNAPRVAASTGPSQLGDESLGLA